MNFIYNKCIKDADFAEMITEYETTLMELDFGQGRDAYRLFQHGIDIHEQLLILLNCNQPGACNNCSVCRRAALQNYTQELFVKWHKGSA